MKKIAINGRIFTVLSMEELNFSDTVRGRLTRSVKGSDFHDHRMTAINVAYDHGCVGVSIIDSPIEDVIEFMEEAGDIEIPNFDVPLVFRDARADEVPQIQEIIASIEARRRSMKPRIIGGMDYPNPS